MSPASASQSPPRSDSTCTRMAGGGASRSSQLSPCLKLKERSMPRLDAATVGQRLGLGDDHKSWLAELEATSPTAPLALQPSPGDLSLLLDRLGIAGADAADLVRTWPSLDRTAEVWWLVERCHSRIVSDLGGISEV